MTDTYVIRLRNLDTGEEWDQDFETKHNWDEWRRTSKQNVDWVQTEEWDPKARDVQIKHGDKIMVGDPGRLGRLKPESNRFNNKLRAIHDTHRGSQFNKPNVTEI